VAYLYFVRCELPPLVITEEKLNIFRRYAGDVDGWVLARDAREHEIMADSDWAQIEELRHRLWLEQHSTFPRISSHRPRSLLPNESEMRAQPKHYAVSSNQSMKPTAPPRNAFSVFATTPCRGLSLSR
jgi:hypothetical protein